MGTKESISKWAAKNRNALFLMGCVVLGQVLLYFITTHTAARKINQYKALRLAGRVKKVMPESTGFERVQFATGETQSLATTPAAQEYLQAGDSLVKATGSEVLTVYRRFPAHTEVSVFGPDGTDKTGLIKRYQINKP
ncbi:MAG: hypothetical protein JWR44_2144 [Hymenobacter sp.]|jgi:hypothetical protein|nr:hypothetical protein [Hymenobacter sp.]